VKPARLRPLAEDDLVAAARYYAEQGAEDVAERVFDAAVAALGQIQHSPGLGSPRLGALAGIRGLRSWQVEGFPLRWFYFEAEKHLDIVRLLGERRDILAILGGG
jgi:toxin ParE1/3/4